MSTQRDLEVHCRTKASSVVPLEVVAELIESEVGPVQREPGAPGTSTNIAVWMGHRSRIAKTWLEESEPGEEALDQRATQPVLDQDLVISDELIGREGPSSEPDDEPGPEELALLRASLSEQFPEATEVGLDWFMES